MTAETGYFERRAERIHKSGQFGCDGRHKGSGSPDCPRRLHHHHDMFCDIPSPAELMLAGVDPDTFTPGSRA